jgi:hypothetical protein
MLRNRSAAFGLLVMLGLACYAAVQNFSSGAEGWWHWVTHDAAGFFTLLLVCVSSLQAMLFLWQLTLINKSLAHAKKAADAAKDSAEIARDTLTKVRRPYLFVFGTKYLERGVDPTVSFVTYSVANYGETPAIVESVGAGFDIAPLHVDEDHSLLVAPILAPGEKRDHLA